MSSAAKISAKYQVTLPREVRKALNVKVGDLLVFVPEEGTFRMHAAPGSLTRALRLAGSRLSPNDFRRLHSEFEEGWEDDGR